MQVAGLLDKIDLWMAHHRSCRSHHQVGEKKQSERATEASVCGDMQEPPIFNLLIVL